MASKKQQPRSRSLGRNICHWPTYKGLSRRGSCNITLTLSAKLNLPKTICKQTHPMEISNAFGSGLQGSGFKPWRTKGSGSMRLHGCLCSQRQNARWKLRPSSPTPVESTNARRFLLRFLEVAVISQNISTKQNNTNTIHTAQAINCGELDSEDVSQGFVVSRHGRVAPQFGCSPWIGSVFGAVFNNVLRDTNQQQHIGNIHWINIVSVGLGCGVSKMEIQ